LRIRPSADRRCPRRLSPRPALRRAGFALALGLALPGAAAATIETPFDGGMPLVLKDGRIATVSVHVVPFETGSDKLDAETAATVQTIFEPLATDCFLTAQAIGHVAPGITRDGDTLSAHRLARARADALQTALVDLGMPRASVASVWDWQFLLPESRATVWVFSLARGDDCDGTPLPQGEPAVAAAQSEAVTSSAEASPEAHSTDASSETAAIAAAPPVPPAAPEPNEAEVAEAVPPAAPEPTEAEVAEAAPAELRVAGPVPAEPATATSPAAEARDPLATAAVAPAAPATATAAAAADDDAAAAAEPPTTVAAIDADAARGSSPADGSALAIDFEVNSSYFSTGAVRELRAFLDSLPADEPVEIELAGAVGTSGVRGAGDEEAARYNAWMAERRIERVAEWLEQNAGDRRLTLAERLVENDSSRQVRLRVNVPDS